MPERSWVSHYIVPCPGDSSCKHCKPGEAHPQQHTFSKLVRETNSPQTPVTKPSPKPLNEDYVKYLRRKKLMGVSFGNLDPIPLDPEIDPQPYACFKCWSLLHLTRHCQETASHVYCSNCGRKYVSVEECPRCAKAYREYQFKWQQVDKEKRELNAVLRKVRRGLKEEDLEVKIDKEVKNGDEGSRKNCQDDWRDGKIRNESVKDEFSDNYSNYYKDFYNIENDTVSCCSETYSDYFFYEEDEENYDNFIVDEDERSEKREKESYTISFFLDLLDALKLLPIEMQTSALLKFVDSRKKKISKR